MWSQRNGNLPSVSSFNPVYAYNGGYIGRAGALRKGPRRGQRNLVHVIYRHVMGGSNSGAIGAGSGVVPENVSCEAKERPVAEARWRAHAWRKDMAARRHAAIWRLSCAANKRPIKGARLCVVERQGGVETRGEGPSALIGKPGIEGGLGDIGPAMWRLPSAWQKKS